MLGVPESMALGGKVPMSCILMRKYLYLGPKVPGTHRILILRLKSPHISRAGIDESSSHQIDAQKTSFLPPTHLLILPPLRRHELKIAGEDASTVRLGSPGGFPDPAIVEAQSLFPAFLIQISALPSRDIQISKSFGSLFARLISKIQFPQAD